MAANRTSRSTIARRATEWRPGPPARRGIVSTPRNDEAEALALATPFDPMAGGFPVPPMPGQQYSFTSRRELAQGTTIVQERAPEESAADTDPATEAEAPSEEDTHG